MESFVDDSVQRIREQVGNAGVVCGVSGGIDSCAVAALVHRAIGDQLTLMDIRVQKGPKQDGDSYYMVTRLPVAWWWLPIQEHPGSMEVTRAWQVMGAIHNYIATNKDKDGHLDIKDDTGKVANWGFEMGSPNGLMRAGWTRNSMKLGDMVTVEGSRAKDGSNHVNARTVVLASTGQKLFAASSQGQ